MRILDSDTLSHLWANHELVGKRLAACADSEIAISSVTKCEILRMRCENLLKASGIFDLLTAQTRLDRTEQQLGRLVVIPFEESAGKVLERLEKNKKLKKIGRADLLIASIALANDAVLVTRNLKHFRQVPDLMLENWVD
jgi:tRNA(fMet)-specific endonuclease VapC